MGLHLDARCDACGLAREGLKVGASLAMMSGERRSSFHLFPCAACRDLAAVELFLGEPREGSCPSCGVALDLTPPRELRVVPMSGLKLEGHPCPRCAGARLGFVERGRFL